MVPSWARCSRSATQGCRRCRRRWTQARREQACARPRLGEMVGNSATAVRVDRRIPTDSHHDRQSGTGKARRRGDPRGVHMTGRSCASTAPPFRCLGGEISSTARLIGATERRIGPLNGHRGTLLLDEVGDPGPEAQAALRAIEARDQRVAAPSRCPSTCGHIGYDKTCSGRFGTARSQESSSAQRSDHAALRERPDDIHRGGALHRSSVFGRAAPARSGPGTRYGNCSDTGGRETSGNWRTSSSDSPSSTRDSR